MSEGEAPKIIIDTDWKSQAQAEKDRLAAEEHKKKAQQPARGAAPGEEAPVVASFEELVRLLATQALMYLGAFPDQSGRAIVALDYAQLHIDLLGVLEAKSKGNLTEQESTMLTRVLHELRMQFVEITRALEKAAAEGRLQPRSGAAPAAPDAGPLKF